VISYEEALQRVLSHTPVLQQETVALEDARGRFLARATKAKLDMPRFDQSAMDGYAVRVADLAGASDREQVELAVIGELPAGSQRRLELRSGTAAKVFTGSRLPAGTEAVVMKEYCEDLGDHVRVKRKPAPREHIRFKAEEFRRGDPLLPANTLVTPPVIGLLATFGHSEVRVHRRPHVSLITIGDELVPPGGKLGAGKIYNSNQPALAAALHELGVVSVWRRLVGDDPQALMRTLKAALRRSDVVITAGGASVGDHDHVRAVAAEMGIREVFRKIAVKPGKPVIFGLAGSHPRRLFFGLPGNSVSALLSFYQLVKPALLRMMGAGDSDVLTLQATLSDDCRKRPGRLEWLRGRLIVRNSKLNVHPCKHQGSHMMSGLAEADCLIHFPREHKSLKRGESVTVHLLSWRA
jgi:molybdopterin molybdotransferase